MREEAAEVLAFRLKLSRADVRGLLDDLEHAGVYVSYVPTTDELCPACTAHLATERSGFCVACTTQMELERQREADDAEEARLREEATRAIDDVKQDRKRMREVYAANPRTKTLKKWAEWFVVNVEKWELFSSEVDSLIREEGARP